jgi:hypothetical protein
MPRNEHLTADELKVLTLKEWAKLNGFSWMPYRHAARGWGKPTPASVSTTR